MYTYEKGIDQAAEYRHRLGLKEIGLPVFVELSEEGAKQLEKEVAKNGAEFRAAGKKKYFVEKINRLLYNACEI